MKSLFILLLLIVLVIPTFGQNVSVLDASLKWNIGYHCVNVDPIHPSDTWSTGFFHTEGDTVFNEKHYQKLIACVDSLCDQNRFKNYVREEGGRIFFANKTEELIQYDFNLQKGDTMILNFLWNIPREMPLYIRIDSVDTMKFMDQKARRVQYVTVLDYYNRELGTSSINDVFVEGIGSLKFGIQYPRIFVTGESSCFPSLLCFYMDKNLIYSNTEINNCYLSTGLLQLKQPELIQVSTNIPGMLEIQLIEAKTGRLFIFDLNGKQILGQAVNQSDAQFCLPSVGVYLYRFVSDKGKVQSGKVLIE